MSASASELEDIAAEWAVKVDAGPLEPGEQAALDAWLDASPRHVGAFARARAALAFASADTLQGHASPEAVPLPQPSRRRFVIGGSIAAGLAGIAIGAPWTWKALHREIYSTSIGETKVVPLADGSVVTLNTDSEVRVNYTETRRAITLVRGEALFDVAHNRARPFVVTANGTTVRAVGTSFTVSLLPDQPVRVLVREGVVEVKRPDAPVAPPVRVAANTRAIVPVDAPIVAAAVAPADVSRALVWRVGRIAFEGETLKEAAAEFARYSDTRIVIDAPDVENRTVAGLFVSNDPVGFSKAVAASFDLKMEVGDHEIRLSH